MTARAVLLSALLALAAHGADLHPSLPTIGSLDGLGVNIHFTDPQPGEMEMIAAAGFKWVRMDFTWAATERVKGEYDFSAYDRLVGALDKHKLRAVFILDYGNPLYGEAGDKSPFTSRAGTPEFREAFARWAVVAVSRYKGKGYLWELWNEPNIAQFWKPKPSVADYIALAKATASALRDAGLSASISKQRSAVSNSGEALIGPATSKIDLPFLEECFKAGLLEHWAGVSVHPYRQTAPETVEDEYRSLRLLIRRYAPTNKQVPILSGEWGYSTAWKRLGKDEPVREEQQARYLSRMFLTSIANNVPLSIWYDWRDDGDDPNEGEHRFGIVRRPYHEGRDPVFDPKPAYQAAKTLTGQLAEMRFNKRLGMGREEYYHLLFEKGDDLRAVVWKTVSSEPMASWIEARPGKFATVDHLGQPQRNLSPREEFPRVVDLPLSTAPLYLIPQAPDDVLRLAAAWDRAPLEVVFEPGKSASIRLAVRNPLPEEITLIDLGEKLAAGARKEFTHKFEPTRQETTLCHFNFGVPLLCRLWQTTNFVSTKPLRVAALPIVGSVLPVRIENPSGEPFEGELKLESGDPADRGNAEPIAPTAKTAKVEFSAGQTDRIVVIRLDRVPERIYYGGLHLYERDGGFWKRLRSVGGEKGSVVWASVDAQRILNLTAINAADFDKTYSAQLDGNAQVVAANEISLTKAPEGLPSAGETALKLTYRSDAGWKFFRITPKPSAPNPIHGAPQKFVLWLHGDGKGGQARIRFSDSSGQCFQSDGPKIDWKGWRYVTFPMQATEDEPLTRWGGANDGKIHYPIQWDTLFLLDNVSREPVEGEIYLSAPTLIY